MSTNLLRRIRKKEHIETHSEYLISILLLQASNDKFEFGCLLFSIIEVLSV